MIKLPCMRSIFKKTPAWVRSVTFMMSNVTSDIDNMFVFITQMSEKIEINDFGIFFLIL